MGKTIAIIPARGGSKRLPNKNILPLHGIPLIGHSILYALANKDSIDEVYVSTDNQNIKNTALDFGAKVIDRPALISGDFEPTITALEHVLKNVEEEVDNVVLLQPTNPLRPEYLLEECFEHFQKVNADSLFTVTQNQHKLGKIIEEKFVPFNYEFGQRSQDLEPLYYENGLVYITKANVILKGEIITSNAIPFRLNHIFAHVDIDTQEDLDYAEYLIKNRDKL
jgi:CMP-N-acetylneuraminic acid synthetase